MNINESKELTISEKMVVMIELMQETKEDIDKIKQLQLKEEDIKLLKQLASNYEKWMINTTEEEPKIKKRSDDKITTTSVRVYNKVWKRWQEFCKEWTIYNSVDLIALALEEFMDRYSIVSK